MNPTQPSTALETYTPQAVASMPPAETATAALAAQAKAMIEARFIMAMQRPRDLDMVRQRLLKECQRPTFAEVARYRKPIGKGVEGPSIRFAEAAIRCMTNIVVETLTVFDDREKRIVRVSVTDLEANVPYSKDVTIPKAVERRKPKPGDVVLRQRVNSHGEPVFLIEATDDEILNQENALISKAVRTLGLRLVPGDLIDEAMDAVMETLRNRDAQDPDAAKRKLFDAFAGVGVTVDQIKEYLGHKGDVLNPKELADLRGLFSALRDGETTWREIMEARLPEADEKKEPTTKPTPTKRGPGGLKDALKKDEPQAAAPAPASAEPPAEPQVAGAPVEEQLPL
ncbi:MAG: hypothetical protein BWY56_01837 [Acidobacteria bacterium ADurb.Bin340]|nr:MAG: hypothetical protein BWY56_01837 [Acidobacteria bacterium ADurb.Bin340]